MLVRDVFEEGYRSLYEEEKLGTTVWFSLQWCPYRKIMASLLRKQIREFLSLPHDSVQQIHGR
jgi:hypothetical protein